VLRIRNYMMRIRTLFTLMRIRILLLIIVMQVYDHWSSDPGSIWSLHTSLTSTALHNSIFLSLHSSCILTMMLIRIWFPKMIGSMWILITLFTSRRIRILLHTNVMQICDHWSSDPSRLYFEPPRLNCEHSPPSIAPFFAFSV
jgi:predicted anti-sigma-YlaC factor YlaD